MKWIHSKSEMPCGPHFAVVVFSTYQEDLYPHEGYGPSTSYKADYIVFDTQEEWKNYIKEQMLSRHPDNFVAIEATPAQVKTKIEIEIK